MPKYTVEIQEQITECREYEIEAESEKEAVQKAHDAWVVNGKEPDLFSLSVDERDYFIDSVYQDPPEED
jgi:hypothetical protein